MLLRPAIVFIVARPAVFLRMLTVVFTRLAIFRPGILFLMLRFAIVVPGFTFIVLLWPRLAFVVLVPDPFPDVRLDSFVLGEELAHGVSMIR